MCLRPWHLVAVALLASPALAAEPAKPPVLNATERTRIIEAVLVQVRARHHSPELGELAHRLLRARLKRGDYDAITDPERFAEVLTVHLEQAGQDAHFVVIHSAKPVPTNVPLPWEPAPAHIEAWRAEREAIHARQARFDARGITRVEWLEGNVGYLRISRFPDEKLARDATAAAMTLLSSTDALIVDLRGNGGGDSTLVAQYLAWLLPAPVHVRDTVWRGRETTSLHTPTELLAGRYGDKEVYLLTDKDTFSSAELFAYDLQARKRARVVGEKTRGGANTGVVLPVDEHFLVGVPMGRTVHAVTRANWEGTGVTPDVAVPTSEALRMAYAAALDTLVKQASEPERLVEIQSARKSLDSPR
ncbi:S41 family peptidase [Myxococcus sp. CA051A]|uniref:S41 family peptidase n=1 Tax=Myxococcus sp. CA051A TaxID=2741739 RepID=UPI00157A7120|nr:S41 family peptidase [Myxococcus sp. CA051A]NTX62348.1 S41 family peptidase [Myxococcus sp. CA051A]